MSFAIFDSLFVILSEEIDVPVSKLKKAWDISLLKFFKTDPNVLAKVAPKLQQAKKPTFSSSEEQQQEDPSSEEQVVQEPVVTSKAKPKKATKPKESKDEVEPKTKKTPPPAKKEEAKQAPPKEPIKLPNCDEANCTIKVKLSRPIDGKNYCSKHYQKHSKALAKKDGLSEDSVKPTSKPKSTAEAPKQQPVKEPFLREADASKKLEKSDSEDEESPEEDIEPELETEAEEEEMEEEHLESEQEDDESPEMILQNLKEGFDGYFKQPVTAQNFTKVGTMDQYLVFFRNNWHDFQKVYEGLVTADELQALIQKKKVQKADLFMLFEKISPKLVSA